MHRKSGNQRYRPEIWRRCRTIRTLKQIHALTVIGGQDPPSLRELIFSAAIVIPNALHYAHKLFKRIPCPDVFMYNTMIRASSHGPSPSDAISLYQRMNTTTTISPNIHTFPFLLRACSRLASVTTGQQLHGRIVKAGVESDGFVRNALINFNASCGDLAIADKLFDGGARDDVVAWSAMIAGYARRGEIGAARKFFDEAPCKDLVSWNVMITAYAKLGQMASARKLFDEVPNRDVVSWNAMISGYAKCGDYDKSMELFEEMRAVGVMPDKVTFLSLLFGCANSGALDAGERLHSHIVEMGLQEGGGLSLFHGNALIDMYAKCGCIVRATDVFEGMRERDVTTWNAVIGGLAFHGHVDECLRVFVKMLKERVRPDEITFVAVLSACSHGGRVEIGRRYYTLMKEEYSIHPNVKHYGCMVDMLGRAGLLKEAFEFVETMDVKPNSVVWRALLGACRLHNNAELGERANKELLKLGHDASGDYILLSNIYASMGEWDGAENVRKLMDGKGVSKEAGRCRA